MKKEDKKFWLTSGIAAILLAGGAFVFGLGFPLLLDAPAKEVAMFDTGIRFIVSFALFGGLLATLVGLLWPVSEEGPQP